MAFSSIRRRVKSRNIAPQHTNPRGQVIWTDRSAGPEINHQRTAVTWSDNSGAKPAPFAQALPKYEDTKNITAEFGEYLEVGALWKTKFAMSADSSGAKYPALITVWWEPEKAPIRANSILIYAGIVRIDERESNGRIVSVPRHTFIGGEGRYIITDFNYVTPVK